MKTASNTFVLGAGASMDYGFPSGQNLKKLAIDALTPGNGAELSVLIAVGREMGFGGPEINKFREDLANAAMDPSIDSFIEAQQDNDDVIVVYEKIAKAVIALLIIKAEQLSNIPLGKGWYSKLFTKMYEDRRTYDRFLENKISFVTFNYDRSLEYYLTQAVKQQFNKVAETDQTLGLDLGRHFPLIHVHGEVGNYWQPPILGEFTKYDGDWKNSQNVLNCASKIKLITDKINVNLDPGFIKARELIRDADTVHFIGFGFHRNNMARLGLGPENDMPGDNKHFGTIMGLTSQKIAECQGDYDLITGLFTNTRFNLAEPIDDSVDADGYLDIAPLH